VFFEATSDTRIFWANIHVGRQVARKSRPTVPAKWLNLRIVSYVVSILIQLLDRLRGGAATDPACSPSWVASKDLVRDYF